MRIIKLYIYLVLFSGICIACVDRYYLEDHIEPEKLIVIDATIARENIQQTIRVSFSSSAESPENTPYSNCIVEVSDSLGNSFLFSEDELVPGNYNGTIDTSLILFGSKLKLTVKTPDNNTYESTYEEVLLSPSIKNAYYELNSVPTTDPDYNINGVQFYIDFQANKNYGTKYMYTLIETWEYHATWPKGNYLDESGNMIFAPPDRSTYVCYKTKQIADLFLLSTSNLVENSYVKFPINFVNDHTQRLMYNYSLQIKQLSITDQAYIYWETLKQNNQDEAGLFARQPSQITSNLSNINKPSERVLGYFTVAGVSSKRILLKTVSELSFDEVFYCNPIYPSFGFPPTPRPLYLVMMEHPDYPGNMVWGYANSQCFDCTKYGGTTDKPDFFNINE